MPKFLIFAGVLLSLSGAGAADECGTRKYCSVETEVNSTTRCPNFRTYRVRLHILDATGYEIGDRIIRDGLCADQADELLQSSACH